MSARKFRNSWWADFSYRGRRHRLRSPDNSRAGAQAFEALLRSRIARGEPLGGISRMAPAPSFRVFSATWFDKYVKTNNRPSEQKAKRLILAGHLVPAFGVLPLDAIRGDKIESYKAAKLALGLSPKTINNHLAVLRKCLRVAEAWGTIAKAPEVVWLKAHPHRDDYLRPEERERLLGYDREPFWRELIFFALCTGLRRGELVALDWSDVDLQRRTLTVRRSRVLRITGPTKNNRERHLELGPKLCALLQQRTRQAGLLFGRPDGTPLSDAMMTRAMRRACPRLGIRHVSWHVLRHSVASYLAWEGHPMLTIQTLLGHSSVSMTERYTHLSSTLLASAAADLERGPRVLTAPQPATGGQRSEANAAAAG